MTAILTWGCAPPDCARAADIDTFFWGALIFLALFVSTFLLWKAIQGPGNRTPRSTVIAKKKAPKGTWDPEIPDPQISWDPEDLVDMYWGDEWSDMRGMNQSEQEEFLLAHGPHKLRKAIKERRKAREKAQKQSGSN